MGRLIALVLALVAGALIAWQGERLPEPKPIEAPAAEFSAARAMRDVVLMSQAPHPVGSPQNAKVRDELVRRMTELGLSPQVRSDVGVQPPKWDPDVIIAGRVENVIGVLPGRDRNAPAVALMAHYDSVPGSPGAADDIAGVAAALEIARAIKARGVPARDVVLVMTDGEEAGLLGANAFFRRDPLAGRVGLVFNLEARGAGGRTQMFQTSAGNGGLVDLLRRTAEGPAASSLAVYIYERMPNDTDLTEALRAGKASMNYAFVGRQFDYHSPTATAQNLERGSLQDLGDQVLATAGAAAFAAALPAKAPDAVFSQVFGDLVVAYPPWAGWLVVAAAALLMAAGWRRARAIAPLPWTDVARGAGAALFAVLGAIAVLQFARHVTGAGFGYLEQRYLLAQVTRWETAVMLLGLGFLLLSAAELARGRRVVALIPLAAGVGCQAFGALDLVGLIPGVAAALIAFVAYGRPVSRPGAWTGVLLVGLVLAVAAQALAAPAAFALAWPLLAAAVAAAGTAFAARRGYAELGLLALVAALGLGWIGGFAHGAFLSMDMMPLMGGMVLLAAFVLWPLAQPADGAPPGRWLGAVLLLAGLAVTLWVRLADPYDARHPQAAHVLYHVDLDARRAFLVSPTTDLPEWSEAALTSQGGTIARRPHWLWADPVRAAPAAFVAETPPAVALARRADGTLALTAVPPPGGRTVSVRLSPDRPLTLLSVGGAPVGVELPAGKWSLVRWAGAEGAELALKPAGPGRLQVRAGSTLERWPAGANPLPAKPADVMGWDVSDSTLVTVTRGFSW